MESLDIKPDLMVHAQGGSSMAGRGGVHVGSVDHVDGKYIKLKRDDADDGMHHWIPLSWVTRVDDKAVYINKSENEYLLNRLDQQPAH